MVEQKIIHLDLDAFFCAVEELRQPDLRAKPFAVGGRPQERGVVSSCSYAARQFGVHSAMPMAQALRLCPNLIVIAPDHTAYHAASEQVMSILREWTALVEQISIDEAFLDVSDLPQPPLELAQALQNTIYQRLHLPCTIGVAGSKMVAKIATDVGKSRHRSDTPPNAIEVVPPGHAASFLAPLPVNMLWGVGPKTAARLADLGVKTIGDLARLPEAVLARHFGAVGRELSRHARGIDDRPVITERATRSISQEVTFDRDIADPQRLQQTLHQLCEQVAFHLRQKNLCAGTVRIKLRWPDFTTQTRQVSLSQPTDQDEQIFEAAESLFKSLWQPGRPVRLLGVGGSHLTERAHQLSLWDTKDQKERRLLDALDKLHERFGDQAVQRGRHLKGRAERKKPES